MALLKCQECGKEISSRALSCPGCGCPQKLPDIEFTDKPTWSPRTQRSSFNMSARWIRALRSLFFRLALFAVVLAGGYTVYHYDIGGIGGLISSRNFLSTKVDKAEDYLLQKLDNPSTYKRLKWGPVEKRYDFSNVGDVYITWVAFEYQDDFGNVITKKAHFKIDAATERIIDFKIR